MLGLNERKKKMLDKKEFLKLLFGMGEIFDKQITDFIIDAYYEIFKDFSLDEIKKAFTLCVKSYKYNTLPKPAEILGFLVESQEDKLIKAWMQVNKAIHEGGFYATVEFKDKIIHHCIDELGGWQWLCSQQQESMPFIEKRFYSIYKIFKKRRPNKTPRLLGFIETKNYAKGYFEEIPDVVRIGFKEEVKMIKGE